MKRRMLSIITALALCLSLCPAWALAAEADPSLCKHHPEHTEDCGYAAPTEGHDCGHQHTAECYTLGVLPDADSGDPYEVGADTENLLDCQHSHDSECGYVEADPGAPCGYVCRICPIKDLIAALPEQVTEDNADDVRAQLDHILDLYRELTEDEQGQLDLSRVTELQGALDGANDPDMIEGEVSVDYQEASWNGSEVTYTGKTENCTSVESSTEAVTWNEGWYVVNSTVTISEPITVTGAVNLILADGCTLNAEKGIVVPSDASLTIYAQTGGSGTLNATGTVDSDKNASAGIGGSAASVDSGTITIHGGEIKATGGVVNDNFGNPNYGGAGIGGGRPGSGAGGSSGAITIYGGTVTANSGAGNVTGAGIGGGASSNDGNGGAGSNITIYGGSVTAASTGAGGAGIGGGGGTSGGGAGEYINIYGGTVNATGGVKGAGVGGGGAGIGGTSGAGTNITVSGGNVTAVGGDYAAGIGGGGGYSTQYSSCTGGTGSVTITGGIVDASSPTDVAYANYKGDPIGNGGNAGDTAATVNKTTGIVFENGAGTVCGDVTLNGSYEVPTGYTLNIPAGASLSGSGTLSGGNAFTTENLTEDMISVPTGLYYTGKDRTEDITTELSSELTKGVTICGQTFTVSGWTLAVEKTDDLHYTATYTNNNDNTNTFTKTITLQKSGTDLSEGKVQTYKGDTLTTSFSADDTITVKATPTATGAAPQKAAARLRGGYTEPTAGQMAVYVNDKQVSELAGAVDGSYTMTVPAAEVLLAAGGPKTGITLTAKFVGNTSMADGAGTATVDIIAAAVAERDGNVIDYFGVSDFEGINGAFFKDAYAGATVALLDDITPASDSTTGKACSTAVNITCTLDLAGHQFTSTDTAIYVLPQGNLTIQDSSTGKTGTVSSIKSDGTLKLYGGTFGKIETAYTLSSLLAENCAYYRGSTPIPLSELEGQKTLDGTVTVQECQHKDVTPTSNNDGTHTLSCPYCGYTKAAEDCDYGEYTHNDTSHTRICKLCGYQNVEVHNIKCTAEASGTVIAVSEACKTCGYGKDLGTVTIHIPKLVYGDLTGVVTAENTLTEPVAVAGNVKNPLGETIIFSDHATIGPPTMATLTGNALLSAGEHKIKINIVIIRDENALAECELTFNVDPAPLTADMVTLGQTDVTYNGTEQKPALSVKQRETPLTEGTDYEVSYTRDGVVTNDFTSAGTVNITVTGKGNYTGSVEKTYTIGKATPTITWSSTTQELTFTGQQAAITAPTVTLVNNESFGGTIHYSYTGTTSGTGLPQNAGTYTIKASIAAQGNYTAAESTNTLALTIKPTPVTLTFANQTIAYGDTPTGATADLASAKIEYSYTIEAGGTPISGWPTNAGTYTVTAKVEATGNYGEASKTATLTITPKEVSNPNIELSPNTFVYDGTEKKPAVTVKDGEKVIPASEYTVAYSNNINAGTATVTITNVAGNYTVSGTKTFTITKANQAPLTITGAPSSVTYGDTFQLGVSGGSGTGALSWAASGATVDNAGNVTITRAGTVVITAVKEGDSNYVGTEGRIMLDVDKADLTADGTGTASGTYGAKLSELTVSGLTAKLGEATVTGTWKLAGDTVPNVGDSGEYTATFTPATGAGNYNPLTAKVKLNIAKATAPTPQTGTLNVQNGHAREYTYDLSRLLPVLASGQSFGGEVTYTLKTVNITEAGYYDSDTAAISGTTLTLPVKAVTSSDEGQIGTITVTISSKNFADVDATINVNRVNKQPVSIEGVTAQNGTYNGGTHNGYTGTPTASPYSGGFKVTYAKADGTALSGAPTNAGDYTVTITLNENNDYTGSRTLSFTISKASITIKADDKRADVGTAKPALTYTVTGLASGDTLATEPTLTCDADMNTIGQYPITASGAAVPSGGNYNTAITYVPGTLSVTDPTIPVTGVTLNKTSTTLTVGGSERLTATVAPSDATDKSVTWTSSNTAVATVDASGNITAVSAGTATITVTTADGAKTATCSVTVRSNSGGGSSYVPSTPSDPSTSTITVPVSGDKDTVRVSASVSGTTATVSKIDTSQIENVIGDNGQASMVEIDFTGLGKTIDTVKLPAAAIKDIAEKAQNEEVGGLTVKLPEAEISFDANALSAIQAQAGSQITLTVTPAKPTDLNNRQKEAVGSAPVFDLTLRSSSGAITDFRGGYATVSLPYTLAAGQNPSGVVVYYLDSAGNITPCTTMYDVGRKSAIFTTGHLSLYFVGYDPTAVWVNPFSDVTEGAWYYDAVRYASENGLMGGYGNGKFGPNDNLSRAQFAQILFNKEGRPVVNYLLRYNDVADGAWYTEAVRWATSQGIVGGYGNGMFGPNDNITREQLAVMLWRYAGSPAATDKELHFTDTDKASGFALEALRWAVENGVMGGYGNGQLAPQGLATRAQVAQMLKNFIEFQQEVSS